MDPPTNPKVSKQSTYFNAA